MAKQAKVAIEIERKTRRILHDRENEMMQREHVVGTLDAGDANVVDARDRLEIWDQRGDKIGAVQEAERLNLKVELRVVDNAGDIQLGVDEHSAVVLNRVGRSREIKPRREEADLGRRGDILHSENRGRETQ